ncbi:hypothetical protein JCM10212_003469 [Sporobolomyces blumeae]
MSTQNPLSGSNRLPVSPRRQHSLLPRTAFVDPSSTLASSSSPVMPTPTVPSGGGGGTHVPWSPPFPLPTYLTHSAYASSFRTTPLSSPSAVPTLGSSSTTTTTTHGTTLSPSSSTSTSSSLSTSTSTLLRDPIPLPTKWDPSDRCALLELSSDSRTASFAGSAKYGDRDAAAVRADRPVPTHAGVYYFEVEVKDKGVSGYIGIGLSHRSVSLSRLPGWEALSYGYHADDGRAFCAQGTGEPFGPTFTTGDVVGCGIDWTDAGGDKGKRERDGSRRAKRGSANDKDKDGNKGGGRVFYTKNGTWLGYAFSNLSGDLYPTIGLRTPNESVRVNFGQEPFKFDIEGLVLERKRTIQSRLGSLSFPPAYYLPPSARSVLPTIPSLVSPPPPSADVAASSSSTNAPSTLTVDERMESRDRLHEAIQMLVAGYLDHMGYERTKEAFWNQVVGERRDRRVGIVPDERGSTIPSTSTDPKGPTQGTDDSIMTDDSPRGEEEWTPRTERPGPTGKPLSELRTTILRLASTNRTRLAVELVEAHFPSVLRGSGLTARPPPSRVVPSGSAFEMTRDQGQQQDDSVNIARREDQDAFELGFKLECRVFVEAVLGLDHPATRVEDDVGRRSIEEDSTTCSDAKGKGRQVDLGAMAVDDVDVDESRSDLLPPPPRSEPASYSLDSILDLGRTLHSRYSSHGSKDVQAELQATLGILAYQDPIGEATEGRVGEIVRGQDRDKVVDQLNRAVLRASNLPPIPALESLYRHAFATVQLAAEAGHGGAALIDVRDEVFKEA